MDFNKLRLDKFNNIRIVNFPKEFEMEIQSGNTGIEVILYYINQIEDVAEFVELCNSTDLPEDNRTIMIYKKGRKDGVNRDSIFLPFKDGKYKNFKLKAPMLCSLSKEFSACVLSKTV